MGYSPTRSSSFGSTDTLSTSESESSLAQAHFSFLLEAHLLLLPSSFDRFSDLHEFKKPNDLRALELMDRAAKTVMDEYPDVVLGFGESDEYR